MCGDVNRLPPTSGVCAQWTCGCRHRPRQHPAHNRRLGGCCGGLKAGRSRCRHQCPQRLVMQSGCAHHREGHAPEGGKNTAGNGPTLHFSAHLSDSSPRPAAEATETPRAAPRAVSVTPSGSSGFLQAIMTSLEATGPHLDGSQRMAGDRGCGTAARGVKKSLYP